MHMKTSFLGVDLAWQSDRNPSGAAALSSSANGLIMMQEAVSLYSLDDVKTFIQRNRQEITVVAVDAPLIITNKSGQRGCERSLSRQYGSRHAACHSSNLTLYQNAASVNLAKWLKSIGFSHATEPASNQIMLEVYPHAAYLELFELQSIIRYKKGTIKQKHQGLRIIQTTLGNLPISASSMLFNLLRCNPADLRGRELKCLEDRLDALFCAYLAFYFWRHGAEGSKTFGSHLDGYIVNPSQPLRMCADASPV